MSGHTAKTVFASVAAVTLALVSLPVDGVVSGNASRGATIVPPGTIQHVIVIMQENRSFDSYFGTYPGADGLPTDSQGNFTVCVNDPKTGQCVKPYHDQSLINQGGPHANGNATADIDGGKMDGFIAQAETKSASTPDVMGYHDSRELPLYWSYAAQFGLQDHMYDSSLSWSGPEHNYLVSGWSAHCSNPLNASTCATDIVRTELDNVPETNTVADYGWTDLTYLLHKAAVSWRYYVGNGTQPDCDDGSSIACCPKQQGVGSHEIWNPLVDFQTVHQDGELGNIQPVSNFYQAAATNTLPSVAWIVPNGNNSEHPPSDISVGENYVAGLVNAVMSSPAWAHTAIFLTWDEWGGFYDHLVPPTVDKQGYGLRVPGLVLSPYARRGYIDHQVLSHDAYNKFIEDVFLGGQRIESSDGRPDPRPLVRESASTLGDLTSEFDFTAPPAPVVTSVAPALGATTGGAQVTISGANLSGVSQVRFGGTAASSFTVDSDSQLHAVSPAGVAGTTDITVSSGAGASVAAPVDRFTYSDAPSVAGLSAATGRPSGGETIVISGSGFTGASAVTFNATRSPSFVVNSDSQITAVTPPGKGIEDVRVQSSHGQSPAVPADRFTFTSPPSIGKMWPTAGPTSGCTTVDISGTGLSGVKSVMFGNQPALTFSSNVATPDQNLGAVAPAGSGSVDVRITTQYGTSIIVPQDRFAYIQAPTITSIAPTSGPAGSQVVITGTGFTTATSVQFGSATATFTVNSDTQITAASPAAGTGTVDVRVTNRGGTSTTGAVDQYSYT